MKVQLTKSQIDRCPRHSRLRRYFWTAHERHAIYDKRLDGHPPPWTNDPIFRRYRFCNVYRELDKVTIWLRVNWREPYNDHPNLAFAMALARLINWPPTLSEIEFPKRWNPDKVSDIIKERQALGKKVYTGAYLLGSIPKGTKKADYLIHSVLTPLYKRLRATRDQVFGESLEEAWRWFRSNPGIGDFLSYEIVSDLRWTHYLCNAPDRNTWANAGPGALRGLTRLWGYQPRALESVSYTFPKEYANAAMQMLLKESRHRILKDLPAWEMREVEHWLCEWDKYCRIKEGQGILERFIPKGPDEW